jgi:hypothetical protein
MSRLKEKLTEFYIKRKTRKKLKAITQPLAFPIEADSIKNVLVILPGNLNYLEAANQFVRNLRDDFSNWSVDIFDVDKITKEDLNRWNMPSHNILSRLIEARYKLVIDLHTKFNLQSAFLTVMTEAPYRINLDYLGQPYFNIQYAIAGEQENRTYSPLFKKIRQLFVISK